MKFYTIGFTRKSAERFFGLLRESGAKRVVDIRRRNTSGLAGFAKKDDLAWFLRELCGMDYIHLPRLSPTDELLDAYRKKQITWDEYVPIFNNLIERRLIRAAIPREIIADSCLLCSEPTADRCHRRLVAEHLQRHWGDVEIVHLV
ncbi:MAG: DUF488 domain-containing protein [Chloroflexota bacterium]|nr:DUF488 domain-containing protein [Chloroflexota bacterium]MDE2685322.1 DUF488 domain-containing protein [Chloroflexota bacterium]